MEGRSFRSVVYGTSIRRALDQHRVSITDAAAAMGYKRADMLYRVMRNEADPSLDALQKLADKLNVPVGDLLPNSGGSPVADEMRDILAAISGVAGDDRSELLSALAINARVMANAFRRPSAGLAASARTTRMAVSGPSEADPNAVNDVHAAIVGANVKQPAGRGESVAQRKMGDISRRRSKP